MGLGPDLNNCTGGGCGGGQCSGGGCNGGSCGGSGCSNHTANSDACTNRVVLGEDGYRGGAGKESIRIRLDSILKEYYEEICNRPTVDNVHYVKTDQECDGSIPYKYSVGVTYKCINGFWYAADGGNLKDLNQTYETKKAQKPLYFSVGGGSNPCKEEPIYDHHGCIVGYKPFLVAEGEFGIWNTTEIYPMTKNCGTKDQAGDCEYVYGDLAGKNVRLFRTPSVSREPFYIGGRDGVPNRYDGAGMEDDGAYVLMIGLRVEGITPPKNLPKPLCKTNPYTITYVERTEANKSVIGSGLLINTFLGDIGGDKVAVPKIGLNSPEYYDVHLNNGNTFFRGGEGENPAPAYVFHSPDLHLRRPNPDAYRIIIEGEAHGEGFRYGLHDRGDPPEDFYKERKQQKGARQAINLSRFIPFGDPIVRCVKGLSYVRADTKMSNDDRFTYPLVNTYKESCAYLELNAGSGKVPLFNQGAVPPQPAGDQRYADESFVGDTKNHERILKGAANYATITRYIPNQYGSPVLQTYIPIGLEIGADSNGNPLSGGHGLVGDSFVNGYSIKRTSYVSDKTPQFIVIRPENISMGRLKRFGWLMRFLWRILGIKGWAELPFSGNEGEFTNRLHLNNRNGPTNLSGTDIYYYSVVKTNIWAYFNSDCNLYFRQTGAPELGQVHVHRLKGLKRDSSLPFGSKWQDGFLNRFYIPWNVASGFKQLLLTVALFAWCYVIGGTLLINAANDFSQAVAGLSTSVLVWVWASLEMVVGIVWIVIWATSSQDNKIIASMLGIDLQTPDLEWGSTPSRGGSRWAMREGRVTNFENNHNYVNADYSLPNSPEKNFGMGDPYVTCLCPCEKTNKIVYSNKQYQGSHIDSWANFKSNNFLDIDAGLGKLAKIFELNGRLFAHTSDHLVPISAERGSIDQSHLGEGKLLRGSLALSGGVIEGVAGLLDPNAAVVTGWGYVFPDRESKDWYLFNGSGMPESLGIIGCRQFFNENMGFELLKEHPEFNLIDLKINGGIGYSVGVDHENKYLFLTKNDYTSSDSDSKVEGPDGCLISRPMSAKCNKSWTITLDIEEKKWVGFEYFTPHLYAWNRFNVYSFMDGAMWEHNVQGKFQEFYGKKYPTTIEIAVVDKDTFDDFDYQSTIIDTEAYKWKDCDYIRSPKVTFDKLIAYNSHQNTGEVDLFNNNDDLTPAQRSRGRTDTINLEFKGRRWQFSEIIDKLRDFNEFQFECSCEVAPRKLNQANFSSKEVNYQFNDNFLIYRFTFSKHSDIKLFLKNIQTLVDVEHEV